MSEEENTIEEAPVAPKSTKKHNRKSAVAKTVSDEGETVIVKTAPTPSQPVKRFSFTQWAARQGLPSHHYGGLRAFVNNVSKQRTLEEWDVCFKGY